jgi:hypothetical protein
MAATVTTFSKNEKKPEERRRFLLNVVSTYRLKYSSV